MDFYPNLTEPLYSFLILFISEIASLYSFFVSSSTLKLKIVLQFGQIDIGFFKINSKLIPNGCLHDGHGNAITY